VIDTKILNIDFDTAQSVLLERQKKELKSLCEKWSQMAETSTILTIEVTGHTDVRGLLEDNYILSERRASSIGEFLKDQSGCNSARILITGKGETEPRKLGMTDEDHAANRRVELVARFKITKI